MVMKFREPVLKIYLADLKNPSLFQLKFLSSHLFLLNFPLLETKLNIRYIEGMWIFKFLFFLNMPSPVNMKICPLKLMTMIKFARHPKR